MDDRQSLVSEALTTARFRSGPVFWAMGGDCAAAKYLDGCHLLRLTGVRHAIYASLVVLPMTLHW